MLEAWTRIAGKTIKLSSEVCWMLPNHKLAFRYTDASDYQRRSVDAK
jgi:hypothetical protein